MSKRVSKESKPKKPPRKEPKTKKRSMISRIIVGIVGLVGFVAAIVVFLPRPTVSPPSIPFIPNDPFSVTFDVYNNGLIPLNNCDISFGVGQITGKNSKLDPLFIPTFESRFIMPAWKNHDLGIDERFTIVLSDLMKNVDSADIAIIVSYNPWFLPIRREKIFRFITLNKGNDVCFWRSLPIGEPLPPIKGIY